MERLNSRSGRSRACFVSRIVSAPAHGTAGTAIDYYSSSKINGTAQNKQYFITVLLATRSN